MIYDRLSCPCLEEFVESRCLANCTQHLQSVLGHMVEPQTRTMEYLAMLLACIYQDIPQITCYVTDCCSYHCFKILDRGGSCFGLVINSFPVLSSLSQRIVFLLLIPKRKVSQYLTSVGSIFVLLHSYFSFLTGICIDEVNNIMLVSDSDNKHLSCFQ